MKKFLGMWALMLTGFLGLIAIVLTFYVASAYFVSFMGWRESSTVLVATGSMITILSGIFAYQETK